MIVKGGHPPNKELLQSDGDDTNNAQASHDVAITFLSY
jgi:hypothetical protein